MSLQVSRPRVRFPVAYAPGQRGVALVVALILLVIATLTGLAGIRNSALQESLTGNMYDRTLAMQAAEAALVAATAAISSGTASTVDCSPEQPPCRVVPANAFTGTDGDWQDVPSGFVVNNALQAGTTPQYLIQWVGSQNVPLTGQAANCLQYGSESLCPAARFNLYRITARSDNPAANSGRALVVLSRIARVPVL
ncbi:MULTISPECIES: PilX N-terminal domain-containing pilus assembly protein [Thauera]|uniref:pilus assembly PilX family protein n=1 Tax=Thauera TaxID=33057 RepID=UPI0023F0BCA8|nr:MULTISPECIES: PilX N-terminal domain-containing pilus assembly protein [Thauera]MDD3673944.1 PilX N-terminal domain-containing pilus assembly protein [Thauera propionica]MDX9887308.1 PilX N-terminal domain-containing pilus assembly protein [Thauera sp.]